MSGGISSAPCFANPYAGLTPVQSQEADRPVSPEEARLAEETEARLVEETGAVLGEAFSVFAMWGSFTLDADALAAMCKQHGADPEALEARMRKLLGWPP